MLVFGDGENDVEILSKSALGGGEMQFRGQAGSKAALAHLQMTALRIAAVVRATARAPVL